MSEHAARWSPNEAPRVETLQEQRAQLRDKLGAARWHLSACLQARDSAAAEQKSAAEEASQLEAKASLVRQEVAACGGRLRALKAVDNPERAKLSAGRRTEHVSHESNPFAVSLAEKSKVVERRIHELEDKALELRTRRSEECARAKEEELELEADTRLKLEHTSAQMNMCEQEAAAYERLHTDLQIEYCQRSEILRAELGTAEMDSLREAVGVHGSVQEAQAQLQAIAQDRSALKAKLEQTRLAAADAACLRAHLRRVTRDAETRSAASDHEMLTAQHVFEALDEERAVAEKRVDIAESELEGMLRSIRSEEKRWNTEIHQACEHRELLETRVHHDLEKTSVSRDAVLNGELFELQQARAELSQVEARSCIAEAGLSDALARLSSSQRGSSDLREILDETRLLADYTQSGRHDTSSQRLLVDSAQMGRHDATSPSLLMDCTLLWDGSPLRSDHIARSTSRSMAGAAVIKQPLSSGLQTPQNV